MFCHVRKALVMLKIWRKFSHCLEDIWKSSLQKTCSLFISFNDFQLFFKNVSNSSYGVIQKQQFFFSFFQKFRQNLCEKSEKFNIFYFPHSVSLINRRRLVKCWREWPFHINIRNCSRDIMGYVKINTHTNDKENCSKFRLHSTSPK